MLTTRPLPGAFGVYVDGLDLRRPLTPDVAAGLMRVFHDNKVIVVPGQQLTLEQFEAYGRLFGTPHPHVLTHRRLSGHPELIEISNVVPPGEQPLNGAAFWHTDQSYEAEPASATILYSVQAPAKGGETQIADMVAAYEALSDETQRRIDGLQVTHLYGKGVAAREGEYEASPLKTQAQVDAVPAVTHPLVRPHTVTGRKALYSVAGSSRGIVGMSPEDGAVLLRELTAHALSERFVYRHKYAVGDVIAWDTQTTMHSATPIGAATGAEDTRRLYRISVKGRPRYLQ